ncbi:hypothetical protein KUW00_18015 [Halomonas sp. DP5N14-9]|uniref:hypothetical protein n=1 Tax=Halomonas sp. DP5N14-9 TaxID=2859075 RepID=UPI001C98EB55|nr:hypothetical protein [Halomonas sp. DP5N14-9]MBY5942775.1 hypothetical protein [Halomonas sp. DP5N14-9]
MKLITNYPIAFKGGVVLAGGSMETTEPHGRELIRKGYARQHEEAPEKKRATKRSGSTD